MVNELYGLSSGYAPGVGQSAPSLPDSAETLPPQSAQRAEATPEVRINATGGTLPALSDSKDAAAEIAKSARQIGAALDKADELVTQLKDSVSVVKNYPPFPVGNEDRLKYLNSIDGLRKQLQSLTIPPLDSGVGPVFYPQAEKFPPLDAKTPSDSAVLAFGDAVDAVKVNLDSARQALQAQADQASAKSAVKMLPSPPSSEAQAREISVVVAGQLHGSSQPLAGSTNVLAQL